jgi:hypothetical protein
VLPRNTSPKGENELESPRRPAAYVVLLFRQRPIEGTGVGRLRLSSNNACRGSAVGYNIQQLDWAGGGVLEPNREEALRWRR